MRPTALRRFSALWQAGLWGEDHPPTRSQIQTTRREQRRNRKKGITARECDKSRLWDGCFTSVHDLTLTDFRLGAITGCLRCSVGDVMSQ